MAGEPEFSARRAEARYDLTELAETFPRPERQELRRALLKLIELHERQRATIDADWQTTDAARRQIQTMVAGL